jgi:hypothetical protein
MVENQASIETRHLWSWRVMKGPNNLIKARVFIIEDIGGSTDSIGVGYQNWTLLTPAHRCVEILL